MLFAIEWIRQQLVAGYLATVRFLEALTIESVNHVLSEFPLIPLLLGLVAVLLIFIGFRSHKILSGFLGAVSMGFWGWQIATSIKDSFLSVHILLTLLFSVIGFFIFYVLFAIIAGLGMFYLSFMLLRIFFTTGILQPVILAGIITVVYLIPLITRHTIRTPIEGGALLSLILLRFIGPVPAILLFAISVASGITLQIYLKKSYDQKLRSTMNFRPDAPSPPSREEIEAEHTEEEAKRASGQINIEQQTKV